MPLCQGWNSWWVALIPESTLYIVTPLPVPTVLFVPNLAPHTHPLTLPYKAGWHQQGATYTPGILAGAQL